MDDDHMMMGDDDVMTSSMSMMDNSPSFCSGSGMVMLQGFQRATESSVNCVLFLFEDAVVDNETKYAFAVIGAFLIAFSTEMIRYGRQMLARSGTKSVGLDLVKVGAYAVQMLLAYFLMLLVMLYEYVFLIAIIVGLSTGHFITLRLVATRRASSEAAGGKDIPEAVPIGSSTPCCDNTTNIT